MSTHRFGVFEVYPLQLGLKPFHYRGCPSAASVFEVYPLQLGLKRQVMVVMINRVMVFEVYPLQLGLKHSYLGTGKTWGIVFLKYIHYN